MTADHTQIVAVGETPKEVENKLQEQQIADAVPRYIPRGGECL